MHRAGQALDIEPKAVIGRQLLVALTKIGQEIGEVHGLRLELDFAGFHA